MKINPKINKQVAESVAECRKVIIGATIELLKSIGADSGQDVTFKKTLFLFQHNGNTTETIIADRIMWCDGRGDKPFYMLEMDGSMHKSDMMLSLSNLMTVYKEVRNVVRAE
jgi:hypothetical protein